MSTNDFKADSCACENQPSCNNPCWGSCMQWLPRLRASLHEKGKCCHSLRSLLDLAASQTRARPLPQSKGRTSGLPLNSPGNPKRRLFNPFQRRGLDFLSGAAKAKLGMVPSALRSSRVDTSFIGVSATTRLVSPRNSRFNLALRAMRHQELLAMCMQSGL